MNRRGFLKTLGGILLAPAFIPIERLAMGLPKSLGDGTVWNGGIWTVGPRIDLDLDGLFKEVYRGRINEQLISGTALMQLLHERMAIEGEAMLLLSRLPI